MLKGPSMQDAIGADDENFPFLGPTWPRILASVCLVLAVVAWAYWEDGTLLFWLVRRGQMEALARDALKCDAVQSLRRNDCAAEQSGEANSTPVDGIPLTQVNAAVPQAVVDVDQSLAGLALSGQACLELNNRAKEMGLISVIVLRETDSVVLFRTTPSHFFGSPGVSYIYENRAGKGGLPAHIRWPPTRLSSHWMQCEYQRF